MLFVCYSPCLNQPISISVLKSMHKTLIERSWNRHIIASLNASLHSKIASFRPTHGNRSETKFPMSSRIRTAMLWITCIYIENTCHLKQHTKIFFICNSPCSRAEFLCAWKTVRKAFRFLFNWHAAKCMCRLACIRWQRQIHLSGHEMPSSRFFVCK